MTLQDLNLKLNPFEMITPSPRKKLEWSGLVQQKNAILKIYDKAFTTTQNQIILNWGPYGGGKTFAAYYFGQSEVTQSTVEKNIFIYVKSPKDGSKASQQLIKDIISALSFERIQEYINIAIKDQGEATLNQIIFEFIRNKEIADAIIKLKSSDAETEQIMNRYIFSNITASELRKVGLPRGLKTDNDYIKFIAGVFIAIVSSTIERRIFIWLDEMEDLIYFTSKNFKSFSQTLRDIVDTVNEKLVLFMNFTLAESQEETIRLLLGEALWSRISQKIRFRDLSIDDALRYCQDQIHHVQIDQSIPYRPYNEDALRQILNLIPASALTPREINKKCGEVLEYALEKNEKEITKSLVLEVEKLHLSES